MERPDRSSTTQNRWIVAVLWLFLYGSFALLSPPLLDGADSLHAEAAREMLLQGDGTTTFAEPVTCPDQGPVLCWSAAASMRVFGVGAPQARLPIAICCLLLFLLVEMFARHAFRSQRVGLYAAACLLLSPGMFTLTRILTPAVIVCLWHVAAVFCFFLAEALPQQRGGRAPLLPCLGFATACALNVLTSGFSGLFLSFGTVLLYLLLTRGVRGTLRRSKQLHPVLSIAAVLMIALSWYLPADLLSTAAHRTTSLLHGDQAGLQAVRNVRGGFQVITGHLQSPGADRLPLLLFWVVLPASLLPWSAFLFKAVRDVPWRRRYNAAALTPERKTSLLLVLAAVVPLFFSLLSTRSVLDLLPSLPFLAMLIARWLDREATETEAMTVPPRMGRAGARIALALLLCGTAAALVCGFLLLVSKAPSPHADLAAVVQRSSGGHSLSFVHVVALNGAVLGAFRGPLVIAALALPGVTLLNWHLRRSFQPHLGNIALGVGTLVLFMAGHVSLNTVSPVFTSQRLAATIAPLLKPKNLILVNDDHGAAPTVAFYLGSSNIQVLQQDAAGQPHASGRSSAPPAFESLEWLQQKWSGPERIFLWTDPLRLPPLPSKAYIVAEDGGKQIVSNKAGSY